MCSEQDEQTTAQELDTEAVVEVAAIRIQNCARRMVARLRMNKLRSMLQKKEATLVSLREFYVDIWQITDAVPEEMRGAMMDRLIERDVLDTK